MFSYSLTRFYRYILAITLASVSLVTVQANSAQGIGATVTIVSSGGAVEGSGWSKSAGVITATSSVSINASDITSSLASGNTEISADAIVIEAPLTWRESTRLTLTSAGALTIREQIQGSGASASLVMTSTPIYSLDAAQRASIQLTGATPSLSINGQLYTVVNTKAQLLAMTSSSTFVALGRSLALTDTYSDALVTGAFTSVFDGLGNEVSGLKILKSATTTTNLGFFAELRGATVRNVGVTDVYINSTSGSTSNNLRIGALAGSVGDTSKVSGWSTSAYTTTLTNVWSSGTVSALDTGASDQQGTFFGGGVIGSLNNGTLLIADSRSSTNVSAAGTGSLAMSVGGFIGDASNYPGTGSVHLEIRRSYATGSIVEGTSLGNYYGSGGLVGVLIGDSSSLITDSFSWSSIIATSASSGGIKGYAGSGTISNTYTTYNSFGSGLAVMPNSYKDATNSRWTSLPSGFSSSVWGLTVPGMPYLLSQVRPQLPLYVKVTAPVDGKYSSIGHEIVNATGSSVDLSSLGLTAPTGTPQYSIDAAAANGTYSVTYVSGLSLGGANSDIYYLAPYTTPTSVTITSAATAQVVSWSPSNTTAAYSSTQLTPNAVAASSGTGSISYAVKSAGSTGCSVNSATPPVISFSAAGDCVVRATAAGTSTEATAYKDVVFNITIPQAQIVTWAPTNTEILSNASPLTPSSRATSTGTGVVITYSVQAASGSQCTVGTASGILSFTQAGTCTVRATANSNETYSAAYKDVTFTIGSSTTSISINLDVPVGSSVENGPVNYSTTGMKPGTSWNVVLRSTPQTLASGTITSLGAITGSNAIPAGLEKGWHSITYTGTSLNGGIVSKTVWFEISDSGVLLASQATEPNASGSDSNAVALPNTGFAASGYLAAAAMLFLLGAALTSIQYSRRIR